LSNIGDFFSAMYDKLSTNTRGIPVHLDEMTNMIEQLQGQEYRLEFELFAADAEYYQSQRELQWKAVFKITGYINKQAAESYVPTVTDAVEIIDFGSEIMNLIYEMLDDKQAGTLDIPGFLFFEGKPILEVEFELIPGIAMFYIGVAAIFQQNDTDN